MGSSKISRMSRVGIVVMAAILVEVISIVQYQRVRRMMQEEMDTHSRIIVGAMAQEVEQTLNLTEATMRENLWEIRRNLGQPDSLFQALVYLIADNPHVVGGSLAFIPDYYPSKGRLFEPYAHKADTSIVISQLAGPDYDYTLHPIYREVMESRAPVWSDAYRFGPDSLSLVTYSCPVLDMKKRLVAVCGLDIEVSWLGDTLNARQQNPSSFGMILTKDGNLVAGPSSAHTPEADMLRALAIFNGRLPESANPAISIQKTDLAKEPHWQVVQVYRTDEASAQMRRMHLQQVLLILLVLAILAFMIDRYARNEKKLNIASEEQARIGSELEVARSIQQEMLPKSFPANIYGVVEPALEVGGDLFDFFIRDGKLFFCIGDVSGKGVPAAMLMATVHSMFRLISKREELPSRILRGLNHQICEGNDSNMFVTFFVGCLDLYTGKLHYSSAGHDKPFLLASSASLLTAKSNLPLGAFPDTEFEEQSMELSPGMGLFLYTDGLTEAKNMNRQAFGRPRVEEVLNASLAQVGNTPSEVVRALGEAARRFAGEAPQSDDLTMLMVRYEPGDLLRESLTLTNSLDEVGRLGDFVKSFCGQLDVNAKTASGLRIALEEVVVNVINFAYPSGDTGSLTVYADSNRKEVRFTVVDSGFAFDPTAVLPADTSLDVQNRPIGGLGILLTRKLMDSVSYCRKGDFNVLTLTKSIV